MLSIFSSFAFCTAQRAIPLVSVEQKTKMMMKAQNHVQLLAVSAVVLALAGVAAILRRNSTKKDMRMKTVLVTGCAHGLGRAMTVALIKQGDFVVGSDVNEQGIRELERQFPTKFLALPMDVSSRTSVMDAAARLLKFSGKPCLDVIINNAGILRGGPLVELEDSDMAAMLNVNVLGTFLVTKHFFPLLKTDDGLYRPRVVNLGSEISYAGVAAMFNGPYAMTKFSVEAFSSSLRQELAVLNPSVLVTVMNFGAHESGLTTSNTLGKVADGSPFRNQIIKGSEISRAYIQSHMKPASNVGEAIARMVHLVNPPRRIKLNVSLEMELAKYTPQAVLDFAARSLF